MATVASYMQIDPQRRLSWAASQVQTAISQKRPLGRYFEILSPSMQSATFAELSKDLTTFYETSDNPKKSEVLNTTKRTIMQIVCPGLKSSVDEKEKSDPDQGAALGRCVELESTLASLVKIHDKEALQKQREISLLYFVLRLLHLSHLTNPYFEKLDQAKDRLERLIKDPVSQTIGLVLIPDTQKYRFCPNTMQGFAFLWKWARTFNEEPGVFSPKETVSFSLKDQEVLRTHLDDKDLNVRFLASWLLLCSATTDTAKILDKNLDLGVLGKIANFILSDMPRESDFLQKHFPKMIPLLKHKNISIEEFSLKPQIVRQALSDFDPAAFFQLYDKLYKDLKQLSRNHTRELANFNHQFFKVQYPGYSCVDLKATLPHPKDLFAEFGFIPTFVIPAIPREKSPEHKDKKESDWFKPIDLSKSSGKKKRAGKKKLSHVRKSPSDNPSPPAPEKLPSAPQAQSPAAAAAPSKERVSPPLILAARSPTPVKQDGKEKQRSSPVPSFPMHPGFPFKQLDDDCYDDRVLIWLYSPETALQMKDYMDLEATEKAIQARAHGFHRGVDQLVGTVKYSLHDRKEKGKGVFHDCYVLFGAIIDKDKAEPQFVIFQYTIGSDRRIYHRFMGIHRTGVKTLDSIAKAARGKFENPTPKESEALSAAFKREPKAKRAQDHVRIDASDFAHISEEGRDFEVIVFPAT